MKITRLDAPRAEGGENPLWDAAAGVLHYIDNAGCKVHSFDPASGTTKSLDLPDVITSLALRQRGGAVVTLRSGIFFLNLDTGEVEPVHPLPDPPPHVYNDAKVDARGRWIIGASTARHDAPVPDGGVFRLDPDHALHRLDGDIHFSNGPCFSPDWQTLYFADSWRNTIYAYDYDLETGAVANRRPFADTTELGGLPDGATVDSDGLVWAAIFRAGKLAAFRPDGMLERTIAMPVRLPSSVSFGGEGLERLFVTSIAHDAMGGTGVESDPGAGCVFVIDGLGAKGRAEPLFAG